YVTETNEKATNPNNLFMLILYWFIQWHVVKVHLAGLLYSSSLCHRPHEQADGFKSRHEVFGITKSHTDVSGSHWLSRDPMKRWHEILDQRDSPNASLLHRRTLSTNRS